MGGWTISRGPSHLGPAFTGSDDLTVNKDDRGTSGGRGAHPEANRRDSRAVRAYSILDHTNLRDSMGPGQFKNR